MLPTHEQSAGAAGAIIAVFAALGNWVVLCLVALVGVLLVLHKHGIGWVGDWISGKAKIQYLVAHSQRCDRDLAAVKLQLAASEARHLAAEAQHRADLADMRVQLGKRNDTIEDLFELARHLQQHFGVERRQHNLPVAVERRGQPVDAGFGAATGSPMGDGFTG